MLHRLDEFVLLRSTDPYETSPILIGVGFGVSSNRSRLDKEQEELRRVKPESAWPIGNWQWHRMDQSQLSSSIFRMFATSGWTEKYEELAMAWKKLERERGSLEFLCGQETMYTESLEEAEAEEPDAEELDRMLTELMED